MLIPQPIFELPDDLQKVVNTNNADHDELVAKRADIAAKRQELNLPPKRKIHAKENAALNDAEAALDLAELQLVYKLREESWVERATEALKAAKVKSFREFERVKNSVCETLSGTNTGGVAPAQFINIYPERFPEYAAAKKTYDLLHSRQGTSFHPDSTEIDDEVRRLETRIDEHAGATKPAAA